MRHTLYSLCYMLKTTMSRYEWMFMHPLIWLSSQLRYKGNERFFCSHVDSSRNGVSAMIAASHLGHYQIVEQFFGTTSTAWDFFVKEWEAWIATPAGAMPQLSCTCVFPSKHGDRTINLRQLWRVLFWIRHTTSLFTTWRFLSSDCALDCFFFCSGWSMQRAMSTLSIRPLKFKWSCRASASCGKKCILPFMWNIQAVDCSGKLVFDCICTILIHAYPSSIKFHTSLIKMLPEMESQWDT